jgi:hypothetical protein
VGAKREATRDGELVTKGEQRNGGGGTGVTMQGWGERGNNPRRVGEAKTTIGTIGTTKLEISHETKEAYKASRDQQWHSS